MGSCVVSRLIAVVLFALFVMDTVLAAPVGVMMHLVQPSGNVPCHQHLSPESNPDRTQHQQDGSPAHGGCYGCMACVSMISTEFVPFSVSAAPGHVVPDGIAAYKTRIVPLSSRLLILS